MHKNVKPYIAKCSQKMAVFCILLYVNGEEQDMLSWLANTCMSVR
jgi:hypothetical protein